jgi:hypothetical protein
MSRPPTSPEMVEQYKNDYVEYLIACAKKTIKEEDALPRQIMLTKLSAYCNDIPLDIFVKAYESINANEVGRRHGPKLKLKDFVSTHRLVAVPKSADTAKNEGNRGASGAETPRSDDKAEEKSTTLAEVALVAVPKGDDNAEKKKKKDDGPVKCPYYDHVSEKPEHLKHHIKYTDRPDHGEKNLNYQREQRQRLATGRRKNDYGADACAPLF